MLEYKLVNGVIRVCGIAGGSFDRQINEAMSDGWRIIGGLAVYGDSVSTWCHQGMVREKKEEDTSQYTDKE